MDLSFWLTTVSLLCAAYAGGQWIYTVYIKKVAVAQPSVDIEDAAPPASGALPRLTTQQWMSDLNELPDTFPHLFVVGPTGSGKTTFTTALLSTRKGALVVITPKPDDQWGGLASVTIDDDASFRSVQQMFSSLNGELKQRLVAVKRGQPCGAPLTIVLDDAPALLSEGGKEAASLLKLVARLGRSFRVRLVLLSQSDRVKALGLEGEGDALDNFTRVQLAAGHAGATWQARGTTYQLDLLHVARLAKNDLSGRSWGGLEPVRLPDGGAK